MAYIRKTADEYWLVTNYGYGWEEECAYNSLKEAKQGKREYMENCRELVGIYIKKKRVPITG